MQADVVCVQVNTLSKPLMEEFGAVIEQIENDSSVQSVVLISAKPECFIAGADIRYSPTHSQRHMWGMGQSVSTSLSTKIFDMRHYDLHDQWTHTHDREHNDLNVNVDTRVTQDIVIHTHL